MNKKQVIRGATVLLATAALANAQSTTTGPAAAIWAVARILLACVGGSLVIALIYHSIMAFLVDREHFEKVFKCALWGGFAFGAYGLMTLIQNATIQTF